MEKTPPSGKPKSSNFLFSICYLHYPLPNLLAIASSIPINYSVSIISLVRALILCGHGYSPRLRRRSLILPSPFFNCAILDRGSLVALFLVCRRSVATLQMPQGRISSLNSLRQIVELRSRFRTSRPPW
ncbi:hypothetical protein ACFX13_031568 [Malus domestica]